MRHPANPWLVSTAVVLLALVANDAAAACPFIAPPVVCTTLEKPLAPSMLGPADPQRVEVVYVHLPSCTHCVALAPALREWRQRVGDRVNVRMRMALWSVPDKVAIDDPRVADAVLEQLGAPVAAHDDLARSWQPIWWGEAEQDAFFRRYGASRAQAERLAASPELAALLQRRVELETAAGVIQVPSAIVGRRYVLSVDTRSRSPLEPARFVTALEVLVERAGGPRAGAPAPAGSVVPPPAVSATPSSAPQRAMPLPADFLPVPPGAAALPPRRCPDGGARTTPADLTQKDELARRMLTQLQMWGSRHFRFEGPAGCTDHDFVIAQWQSLVGLPQTGVLGAAEVNSMRDAIVAIQPQLQAAQAEWSKARGAAIQAGMNPDTGRPFTAEELERRRPRTGGTAAGTPAAAFVRPAPVGPPEKQVFSFSLGAPFAVQVPECGTGWRGRDTSVTCHYAVQRSGRRPDNWTTALEGLATTELPESERASLGADGVAMIVFAAEEHPGLVHSSELGSSTYRSALKALVVDGRLEGIGFRPSDRAAVLDAFSSRYGIGIPEPVAMRNDKGANWTGLRHRFTRNDVRATLNCVEFKSGECSYAEVITERGLQALDAWRKGDAQRGVAF
jgi:hypothetical protein